MDHSIVAVELVTNRIVEYVCQTFTGLLKCSKVCKIWREWCTSFYEKILQKKILLAVLNKHNDAIQENTLLWAKFDYDIYSKWYGMILAQEYYRDCKESLENSFEFEPPIASIGIEDRAFEIKIRVYFANNYIQWEIAGPRKTNTIEIMSLKINGKLFITRGNVSRTKEAEFREISKIVIGVASKYIPHLNV
jgi:hypothetical protein